VTTTYSTRFAAGETSALAAAPYTVPGGYVAVVRDVTLWNPTDITLIATLGVSVSGSVLGYIDIVPTLEGHSFSHWTGRQVMNSGDQMYFFDTESSCLWMVSGYLLST
jgi:hypothetical protein